QCRNEKHLLQQRYVSLPCLVTDINAGAELRIVDQLPRMFRQQSDEFRQLGKLLDVGDVSEVTSQNRGQIGPRPILPSTLAFPANRFGKASEQDKLNEFVTYDRFPIALQLPREQSLQKS